MDHQMWQQRFAVLTTAHLADACLRAQVPVRSEIVTHRFQTRAALGKNTAR